MNSTSRKNSLLFILLDDDVCALTMTEKLIRKYSRHSEIITFSVAKEAIAYIQSGDFVDRDTAFLTDLHMPELSGFAVLDRIADVFKSINNRLHIFVMSATTCQHEIGKALAYPYVKGFLGKPISDDKMKHLLSCIQYPI